MGRTTSRNFSRGSLSRIRFCEPWSKKGRQLETDSAARLRLPRSDGGLDDAVEDVECDGALLRVRVHAGVRDEDEIEVGHHEHALAIRGT